MTDRKYFNTQKRGESWELKQELHDSKMDVKKDAVKKVIAGMTVGKDMSSLFPDVVQCLQTNSVELKKLTYLYLINYAKAQPQLVILAINTLRKDCQDANPLTRALALRTMGCIRMNEMVEYLTEPLRKACHDTSAYVRKTAATCIAKVYDMNPGLCREQGFISLLKDMLSDSSTVVVANAIASLQEMLDSSGNSVCIVDDQVVAKLLVALNETNEWSQIYILDALSTYEPQMASDAEAIIERVTSRLNHGNSAVMLSTIRLILKFLPFVKDQEFRATLFQKMRPPMISVIMMDGPPEIKFVLLRSIGLVVQGFPEMFDNEEKVFFVKYSDPIYIQVEKIQILIGLVRQSNCLAILDEFKEYSCGLDMDLTRRAVQGIGCIASRCPQNIEECVEALTSMMMGNPSQALLEASVLVIRDILLENPEIESQSLLDLCRDIDYLEDPEAKAAFLWIVGEYSREIDESLEILQLYLPNFLEESLDVQLQLVGAAVKLYVQLPELNGSREIVTEALQYAAHEVIDPDLRDRGIMYWRLLSDERVDLTLVKPILFKRGPRLPAAESTMSDLLPHLGTVAATMHISLDRFETGVVAVEDYEDSDDSSSPAVQRQQFQGGPPQPVGGDDLLNFE